MAQSTVESIPNQRLINGSYVSNPDGILDDTTVSQIDTLLKNLESKTSVQVAVVAIESIGNDDVIDFAQRLFTKWGIGNIDKNNGLLLLLVKGNRTVRFHTGYGVEGVLPEIVCKRIQRDFMVSEFKNGNYNAGMLAGLQQVERILTDPQYAEELKEPEAKESDWMLFVTFLSIFFAPGLIFVFVRRHMKGTFSDSKDLNYTPYPEMYMKRSTWLLVYVGIPVLIIILFGTSSVETPVFLCSFTLYMYYMLTLFYRLTRMKKVIKRFLEIQDYYEIVEFIRKDQLYWFGVALVFPFPFLIYFFYHLGRKRLYRNHPRKCKQCESSLHKLSESEEDQYLTQSQQFEETIRSVDYDVWKCKNCESIEMWFYLGRKSKYQPCPKCQTIAYHSVSMRTIESASYTSSGKGEEVHACKFCGHTKKSVFTIAQLVASTSSSSSSSFSGGGSSGGSWGGGSSGGGGASSSW
jgi:uncharacterized protein